VIERVEALLREIQTGVGLRLLYPSDHPRIRENVARALALLTGLGSEVEAVSTFVVEDRVIYEGEPLPGGTPLARGLFATLKASGFDRLTLRRGATPEELDDLIGALCEAVRLGGKPATPLRASPHVRFASFQALPAEAAPLPTGRHLASEVGALKDVWAGVTKEQRLDLNALEGIVLALSKTVEENLGALIPMAALKSHDDYTATHITNVGILAMALGDALGMPERVVHDLGIAALLHDVGKLQVSEEILTKPDRLNPDQQATIRRHPEEGARMLLATRGVPELAVAVAYEHHIRYDGGGYPAVPRGWKTTIASAVTQVVDIYDALRTDRPYRRGHPHVTVEQMMLADSGAIFDPELLDVFFDVVVTGNGNGHAVTVEPEPALAQPPSGSVS
jgi:putative nucleotidyltransferase with HDIG domain